MTLYQFGLIVVALYAFSVDNLTVVALSVGILAIAEAITHKKEEETK